MHVHSLYATALASLADSHLPPVDQNRSLFFNRMFYFERACMTYILALQTGKALHVLPVSVAEKTAQEIESYPEQDMRHLAELKVILDEKGATYAQ